MAVGLAYIETMKAAAGLTASLYDAQVSALVEEARAEMSRVGVDGTKAADEADALVQRAVRTYVMANFSESEAEATRLEDSFRSQISAMSLKASHQSADYVEEVIA
jgi:hypothetical protein